MVALLTAYKDAPSKGVKMQILSIYAFRHTAKNLVELHESYESISRWQIKQARNHANLNGPGNPIDNPVRHRVRLSLNA